MHVRLRNRLQVGSRGRLLNLFLERLLRCGRCGSRRLAVAVRVRSNRRGCRRRRCGARRATRCRSTVSHRAATAAGSACVASRTGVIAHVRNNRSRRVNGPIYGIRNRARLRGPAAKKRPIRGHRITRDRLIDGHRGRLIHRTIHDRRHVRCLRNRSRINRSGCIGRNVRRRARTATTAIGQAPTRHT